jgi:hypothetical protein
MAIAVLLGRLHDAGRVAVRSYPQITPITQIPYHGWRVYSVSSISLNLRNLCNLRMSS